MSLAYGVSLICSSATFGCGCCLPRFSGTARCGLSSFSAAFVFTSRIFFGFCLQFYALRAALASSLCLDDQCHCHSLILSLFPLWVSLIPRIRVFGHLLHCICPALCVLLPVPPIAGILLLRPCVALLLIIVPVHQWDSRGVWQITENTPLHSYLPSNNGYPR